jgi:hypothetical protein
LELLTAMKDDKEPAYLGLGFGKPLGFGAMQLTSALVALEDGTERRSRLRELNTDKPPATPLETGASLVKKASINLPPQIDLECFEEWKTIARGPTDEIPVYYPRSNPEENGYEWFVANERQRPPQGLPAPGKGTLKAFEPEPPRQRQGGPRGRKDSHASGGRGDGRGGKRKS